MANDHKHSPWRKSVLVPFWTVQLLFMLVFIALLGLALGVLVTYDNNDEDWDDSRFDNFPNPEHVVHEARNVFVPIWITLCVICLILTITEIILLARHKLRPLAFLTMNVIKTAIWTALFVLDIISAVTAGGRTTSIAGMIIDTILLYVSYLKPYKENPPLTSYLDRLSFWIPLIYGSVIYHRFRREKKSYKPVDHPFDTSYESQLPKAYTTPDIHSDLESANISGLPTNTSMDGRSRRVSFNHERDTRYEAYRKSSFSPEQPVMESFESRELMEVRGDIPQVFVEHHDGDSYEMGSRRELK